MIWKWSYLNKKKSFLKNLNLSVVLSLIGILIAVLFGTYGLYSTIQEDKTEISFEVINEANVFDVHEPVNNLIISFEGEDIQEKNLNIRIITFKVQNIGNVNILQNYYDANEMWGARVNDGDIIRIKLVDSNSGYIKSNLQPRLYDTQTIEFTKTIFEKGDYFTIEILVLHDKDESPTIIPKGKIAGIDEIVAIKKPVEKEETFINDIFQGNFLINLTRFIIFFILGFGLLYLGVSLLDKIEKYKKERCRKKVIISNILELGDIYSTVQLDELIKILPKFLPYELYEIIAILEREEELGDNRLARDFIHHNFIDFCIRLQIINLENDHLIADPRLIKFLKFIRTEYINLCYS